MTDHEATAREILPCFCSVDGPPHAIGCPCNFIPAVATALAAAEAKGASWAQGRSFAEIAQLKAESNELQHAVAECAGKCGVPHDNDFTAQETLDRISGWFLELKAERDAAEPKD